MKVNTYFDKIWFTYCFSFDWYPYFNFISVLQEFQKKEEREGKNFRV